jgi:hypothetical protein
LLGLGHGRGVHRDRAVLFAVVDEIARQRLDVAVEDAADNIKIEPV